MWITCDFTTCGPHVKSCSNFTCEQRFTCGFYMCFFNKGNQPIGIIESAECRNDKEIRYFILTTICSCEIRMVACDDSIESSYFFSFALSIFCIHFSRRENSVALFMRKQVPEFRKISLS